MLSRIYVSFSLALLGLLALTAPSYAAASPDQDKIVIGMTLFSAGLMMVLLALYLVKRMVGLDKPPPPEEAQEANHH
jgi:hypothetical protein